MSTTEHHPAVTLLELFASIPPEYLVEGTRIDVTTVAGKTYSITMGPRVAPQPAEFTIPWEVHVADLHRGADR